MMQHSAPTLRVSLWRHRNRTDSPAIQRGETITADGASIYLRPMRRAFYIIMNFVVNLLLLPSERVVCLLQRAVIGFAFFIGIFDELIERGSIGNAL